MNLVVGATGSLGSEICRRLVAQGKPVRGLVRATSDPARVDGLGKLGIELAHGDLKDRGSLDAACRGVTAVVSTAIALGSRQNGDTIAAVDQQGQLNLVDAARAAGVPRFVYVSVSRSLDGEQPCPFAVAKRTVERHLQRSGLAYTILRPSYFMEAWLGAWLGFDIPNAKAQIFGAGHNKISWIALGDVAQFAVECLEHPAARNAVIELGGPDALSPLEVVRICEELGDRKFQVQHVPEAALHAQRASAMDPLQQSFAALMLAYARGDAIDTGRTLQTYPVRLTSVGDYAKRVLAG